MKRYKKIMQVSGLILLLALIPHQVSAEMTVKSYRESMKGSASQRMLAEVYVHGLGNGIAWAQQQIIARKNARLYCPPKTLSLEISNHIRILDDELEKIAPIYRDAQSKMDEMLIGMLLLDGLVRTFPCK